jgi:hypothetical protein
MAMKTNGPTEITTIDIDMRKITFGLLGVTPIILNSMNSKVMQELLMPKGKKTTAERAGTLKHDPFAEFRRSPYTLPDKDAPTLLAHLSTAFKKAIASTAIDLPGAKKAQLSRLMWVEGEKIPIFGIPQIHMSVTRNSDMSHTPDVRTRCCVPNWAAIITVSFVAPILKDTVIASLLSAAGMIQGVGDWRPEKGSGTYGQFSVVDHDDKRIKEIMKLGGRAAQVKAMENPTTYDDTTRELLDWFINESDKRGFRGVGK